MPGEHRCVSGGRCKTHAPPPPPPAAKFLENTLPPLSPAPSMTAQNPPGRLPLGKKEPGALHLRAAESLHFVTDPSKPNYCSWIAARRPKS